MIKEIILMALVVLPASALALNITNSSIYCIDNTTLIENITVYKDGNSSNIWASTNCAFNCSNSTQSCNPPTYQQNLIVFGLILVIGVGAYLVYKRL